jgi:hypothetical protein
MPMRPRLLLVRQEGTDNCAQSRYPQPTAECCYPGRRIMAKQSSPPPADSDRAIPPRSGVSFSDEEIAALLRLARDKKSWWKDYSLLIAVLAFLLSLVTTMVSTWIGHLKDVHDQQTQLLSLTQDLQDLDLKSRQYRQQYSLGGPIFTSIAQQERAIHSDAVAVALGLGTNAPTGELIILALVDWH